MSTRAGRRLTGGRWLGLAGCALLVVGGLSGAAGTSRSVGTVVVRVVDSRGRPVEGADVHLMLTEEDPYREGRTDASGAATFTVGPPYRFETTARAQGYLDSHPRLVTAGRSTSTRAGFRLLRPATLTGRVRTADGSSPARLGVSVSPATGAAEPLGSSSGVAADGSYTVRDLPPGPVQVTWYDTTGRYLVQCPDGTVMDYADQHCPSSRPVQVVEGSTRTLAPRVLTHYGAGFSGTVTDAHGHPIRGAATYPFLVGSGEVYPYGVGPGHDDTTTDRRGRFHVVGLPAGTYRLLVGSNGSNDWASAAYGGGDSLRTGRTFVVRTGSSTPGIDVTLPRLVYITSTPVTRGRTVTVPVRVRWWGGEHAADGLVSVSVGERELTRSLRRGRVSVRFAHLAPGRHVVRIRYHGSGYAHPRLVRRSARVG